MNKQKWFSGFAMLALMLGVFPMAGSVSLAQGDSRTFPETGHTVKGLFLTYWNEHGGLAQQGYPISEELQEQSDTDGKTYTMQYFERAVFEMHPENAAPFNVLLSLLGVFFYNEKYAGNAPNQHANTTNPRKFTETGKTIGGAFRTYWETHGGLAQQGYPISDEFQEVSDTDGKTYTVQYFQRAVFEYHPEFANTPNEVLLSLLGVFFYNQKHGGIQPTPPPGATSTPTTQPGATSTPTTQPGPTATSTPAPVQPAGQILFFKGSGLGQPALLDQQGTIFYQKTFQHNTADWTHVLSIGDGFLLFYKIAGGGRIGKLAADGTYQDVRVGIEYNAGWNQLAALGNNRLAVFNSTTKTLVTEVIGADGNPLDLKSTTLSLAWQSMVGVGATGNLLYLYMDDPADGFVHKAVGSVDAQGNFTTIWAVTERPRAGEPRGSWYITPLDTTHVIRYNTVSGQYYIEAFASDGSVTDSPRVTIDPGWTNFAYIGTGRVNAAHGVLLFYNATDGSAKTEAVDQTSFTFTDLKSYSGPTALQPGWTLLTSIRNCLKRGDGQ
jgi:hypothetical protein